MLLWKLNKKMYVKLQCILLYSIYIMCCITAYSVYIYTYTHTHCILYIYTMHYYILYNTVYCMYTWYYCVCIYCITVYCVCIYTLYYYLQFMEQYKSSFLSSELFHSYLLWTTDTHMYLCMYIHIFKYTSAILYSHVHLIG